MNPPSLCAMAFRSLTFVAPVSGASVDPLSVPWDVQAASRMRRFLSFHEALRFMVLEAEAHCSSAWPKISSAPVRGRP